MILSVVLYGCATWTFTLEEERRLKDIGKQQLENQIGNPTQTNERPKSEHA